MKINVTTTKEVITEIEVTTPQFWKYKQGAAFAAIYSEDKVLQVDTVGDSYRTITTCRYENIYAPFRIFEGEQVSEYEFNQALAESILKIAGIEIVAPQLELA